MGSGTHCAVRGCPNTRKRLNEWLERECFEHRPATKRQCPCTPLFSFHKRPRRDLESRMWLKALNLKKPPRDVFVCSHHFLDKKPTPANPYPELWLGLGYDRPPQRKRRKLERSTCCYTEPASEGRGSQTRESVYQRARKRLSAAVLDDSQEMPVPGHSTEEALPAGAVAKDHDYACHPSPGKPDGATLRIQELELQVLSLETEIQQLTVKKQQPLIFKFCITDEDFRYYTRFSSKEVFTVFWESVNPSASRLVYWSKAQQTAQETPSPQRKHPLIDEFFMFLCRIAAGLQEKTLSSIFEVSLSTVSRTILTWTTYLYQVLGSLPLWMTREQVQATMPDKFKLYCPQVRVIIDCTEIRCETASSLSLQSETFSNYKNHTTFKGLIGIAPCGVITFVSKLYTGSISDIEITRKSQILQLLQPRDGVMANTGFLIEKMLSEVGATLIIPPLKKSSQLSMEDTQKTQAIAHLRILVERAIRRVKEYHIWDGLVPLYMVGSVNQLWVICCLMSNYQGPLDIKGDKPV